MKLFSICTISLLLYIAMDIIFDDELWELNTKVTLFLQQYQFLGEKEMFSVFSYSLFVMPSIALIAFFFMDNKLGALLYGLMILITIAINSLLKNIYHQPRPYFIEENIEPYECNKEFGKPSGHAMCSSAMCFLLPSILFPAIWKDQENCQYSKLVRILVIFSLTFWTFMTGFSRIFMGVHSIGQILLGWVYSSYIIIMYMTYCHERIMNYIRIRLQPGSVRITNKDLTIVGLACSIWTFVSILFFELNKIVFLTEEEVISWMTALFKKCPNQMSLYNINSPPFLHNICFSLSLYVWIVFGFLLGIKLTNGVYFENQFSQNYSQLSFLKKFMRVFLLLALVATLIPFIILIKFDEVYLQAFLQIFIVSIAGGLILTLFYSRLLHIFKLSVNGDFIQITQQFVQAPEGASFEIESHKNA